MRKRHRGDCDGGYDALVWDVPTNATTHRHITNTNTQTNTTTTTATTATTATATTASAMGQHMPAIHTIIIIERPPHRPLAARHPPARWRVRGTHRPLLVRQRSPNSPRQRPRASIGRQAERSEWESIRPQRVVSSSASRGQRRACGHRVGQLRRHGGRAWGQAGNGGGHREWGPRARRWAGSSSSVGAARGGTAAARGRVLYAACCTACCTAAICAAC